MTSESIFWIAIGLLLGVFAIYFFKVRREIKSRKKQIDQLLVTNDTVQIVHDYKQKEADILMRQRNEQKRNK